FRENNFQRRSDVSLGQMPGKRCSITAPEHGMDMQRRLSGRGQGNVADERSDFDPLANGNRHVFSLLPIKVVEGGATEGPDSGKLRRWYVFSSNELLQACERLIPRLQDEGIRPLTRAFVQQLALHGRLSDR